MSRLRGNRTAVFVIWLLLAVGLGTTALLYTALDRTMLRPVKVPHPESLLRAAEIRPPTTSWQWFTYNFYLSVKQMHTADDAAAEGPVQLAVVKDGEAIPLVAHMVTANYFSFLDVGASIGRTINESDAQIVSTGIPVVLSHHFWKRVYGASKTAVGESLHLNDSTLTIVGVMPEQFYGTTLDDSPDLWLPVSAEPFLSNKPLTDPASERHFSLLVRLKNGVPAAQAQQEFLTLFELQKKAAGDTDPRRRAELVPIEQGSFALREQFGRVFRLLMWALVLLLVMISASVAGVLVVRQLRRERENAIRLALGSTRTRIVLTALQDSLMLGVAGAAGGIVVAYSCAPLLQRLLPGGQHGLPVSLTPDARICALTAALALGLSIVFGVLPAWIGAGASPQDALRSGSATKKTGWLSRGILIVQTACALVLLTGAGLLIHTFYILEHTSPGFDAEHLVVFGINPGLRGQAKVPATFPLELKRRVQSLAGVRDASLVGAPLMQRLGMKTTVALPGSKISQDVFLNTSFDSVSPSFFQTMGMSIISGQGLPEAATPKGTPQPVLVNEAFAHMLFPNQEPIGKTFGSGPPNSVAAAERVIVGVVSDSKYRSLREAYLPIFYEPIEHRLNWSTPFYLYVRTATDPSGIIQVADKTMAMLAPDLPFSSVITMPQQLSESLWQERMLSVLAAIFACISVLVAAIGLYGLLAYDVSRRRREFGIRSALGAQRKAIAALLARETAYILVPGVLLGAAACLLFVHVTESLLYGVRLFDPVSIACALGTVIVVAIVSSLGPVRTAMQVEPATVLREE